DEALVLARAGRRRLVDAHRRLVLAAAVAVLGTVDDHGTPPAPMLAQSAEVMRLVARRGERRAHRPGVLAPARLEDELDGRLADVQVEALADVLDLDEVGAGLPDERQQPRQRARAVG